MGVLSKSDDNSENGGRANIGYVGAFTEPLLSRGLEGAKPRMSFSAVTNGQPPWVEAKAEVSKATCAYRWKYLDQAYGPWKSNTVENVTVYEGTNVIWDSAIEVPDKVGDIEYSYSAWVSGTRYKFFDFAIDDKEKLSFPDDVASATLVHAATNYTSRIREGVSPWQEMHLEALVITNAQKVLVATNNWTMELIDDHMWRGFVHTPTNYAGCVANIRFVGKNMWESNGVKPSVSSKTWYFPIGEISEIPMGGVAIESLPEGGREQDIVLDATSGYLIFEFNDKSGAFTLNRAEYQDFNKWTPTVGQGENKYIGDYVNTSYVGRAKQEYTLDVGNWPISRSTSTYWWENFDAQAGNADYPFGVPFGLNRQTPNGWVASNGMFINGMFSAAVNKTTYGMALQMQGRGLGTMSLIDPADVPQGIGTVSFTARLAQYLEFGDFYYYVDGTGSKNYAISAKAAMTHMKQEHSDVSTGSPSLSLVAYYRPGKGCYEFRITRVYSTYNNLWDAKGIMEIAIYKWQPSDDPDEEWTATKLKSLRLGGNSDLKSYNPQYTIGQYYTNGSNNVQFQNYFVPPKNSDTNTYNNADWTSVYFAAYNNADGSTYLEGGVGGTHSTKSVNDDVADSKGIIMALNTTDSNNPFTKGSYGVCATECPATFGDIQRHPLGGKGPYKGASTSVFGTGRSEESNITGGDWGSTSPSRIIPWSKSKEKYSGTYAYGLCAAPISQKIYLSTAPNGDSSNWTEIGTNITLSSYCSEEVVFSPRTIKPVNIQISVGGSQKSPRTDVVIDNIQLSQWAGDESVSSDLGSTAKWAFTDAWIAGTTNDVYQGAGSKEDDDPAAFVSQCGYYVKQLNDTEFIYVFTNTTAGALGNYATFVPKQDMIVKEVFVLGAGAGGGPGGGGGGGGNAIWVTNSVEYTAGEEGIKVYVGNGGGGGTGCYTGNDVRPGSGPGNGGTSYVYLKNPLKPTSTEQYRGYGGYRGGWFYRDNNTYSAGSGSSNGGGSGGGSALITAEHNPGSSIMNAALHTYGREIYAAGYGGAAVSGAPGGGGGGGLRGVAPGTGVNGGAGSATKPTSVIYPGSDGADGIGGANGGKGGDGFPISVMGESEVRYAIGELLGDNDAWLGGGGGGGSGINTEEKYKKLWGAGAYSPGGAGKGGGGQGGLYTAGSYNTNYQLAMGYEGKPFTGGGGGGGTFHNPVTSGSAAASNWIIGGGKGGGGLVVMHVKIKDRFVMLQPMRGNENDPMSIRTLFLNGLSLLSFSWKQADPNAVLKVQIATNGVDSSNIQRATTQIDGGFWTDFGEPIRFADMDAATREQGSTNILMGLRAPVSGIVRLLVDPSVVAAARKGSTNNLDSMYGTVVITGMKVLDEPELDDRSWWGWNIMPTYKLEWSSLYDPVKLGPGRSCGLNFSGVLSKDDKWKDGNPDYDPEFADDLNTTHYYDHDPFIQTPRFTNRIGSVMFKARVTETNLDESGWVTISACANPGEEDDAKWDVLTNIEVTASTTVFEPFMWRLPTTQSNYQALRLTAWGAAEGRYHSEENNVKVKDDDNRPPAQPFGDKGTSNPTPIQRVLIDEVVVTQPMAPKISLKNAYPFRKGTRESTSIPASRITSPDEQPLLNEEFGMQVQVVPAGMEDELDVNSIKIYMAWYAGASPWGYNNWKNEKYATKRVELKQASDWSEGNLVYRSDPNDVAAFIPAQMAGAGGFQYVQYHIWAEYTNKNGIPQDPHHLTDRDWIRPSWYFGINDPNELPGNAFCAYTVLDSISPKRAWFNEINMFDGDVDSYTNQYMEVAVPQGYDVSQWRIECIRNGTYEVGQVAQFGSGDVVPFKTADAVNSYSFIALQSPATKSAGVHKNLNDGTWSSYAFERGSAERNNPYALRLIRPTGIIEHEVVFMCTNTSTSFMSDIYEGAYMHSELKRQYPDHDWVYAGADAYSGSLGVYTSHGENTSCWTNTMRQTPGKVNLMADGTPQYINPDYFEPPKGTNLWIYANVDSGSMNSLQMVIGGVTNTSTVIIVPQNSDGTFSTSIVYVVTKWFEMDRVVTNEVGKTGGTANVNLQSQSGTESIWTLDLGNLRISDPESRKFEVTAYTKDSVEISKHIEKTDPYYPAIVDWLQNYDEGEIRLAEFWSNSGNVPVKKADGSKYLLNLKQMYWLDIPPVGRANDDGNSEWALKGGMSSGSHPVSVINPVTGAAMTNIRCSVTLMITNLVEASLTRAPDMLRGLEPGSTSSNYNEIVSENWDSVTFKITGALQNGVVNGIYRPLRWFTFGPDSFSATNGYTRTIDIVDPFSKTSPGYSYEWYKHPGTSVFYRWRIDHDTNRPPDTVYQLNDRNALLSD